MFSKILDRELQLYPKSDSASNDSTTKPSPTAQTDGSKSATTGSPVGTEDGWEVASGKRRRKRNRIQAPTGTEARSKTEAAVKSFAENDTWA